MNIPKIMTIREAEDALTLLASLLLGTLQDTETNFEKVDGNIDGKTTET